MVWSSERRNRELLGIFDIDPTPALDWVIARLVMAELADRYGQREISAAEARSVVPELFDGPMQVGLDHDTLFEFTCWFTVGMVGEAFWRRARVTRAGPIMEARWGSPNVELYRFSTVGTDRYWCYLGTTCADGSDILGPPTPSTAANRAAALRYEVGQLPGYLPDVDWIGVRRRHPGLAEVRRTVRRGYGIEVMEIDQEFP